MAERMSKRKIGPFELHKKLGSGGMGIVYLAKYLKTDQMVALKVLTPALSTDEHLLKRFEREMDILKKLRHDHIVRYYGGGKHGTQHFYAMELMKGGSLEDVIKEKGRLSWEQTIDYALQIAKGLEYSHNNGIIHRDLKPANCFLTKNGHLKLGDFGVARDTQATALTAAGRTVGTFAYMAPEQISGSTPVSQKTDLYALGCVMYEMLTGKPPFQAETPAAMLFKHLKDDPIRVTSEAIDCPLALETVVEKLLQKEPEERYFDALALQVGLDDVGQKVTEQAKIAKQTITGGRTKITKEEYGSVLQKLLEKKKKKKKKKQSGMIYEQAWFLVTCLLLLVGIMTWAVWPLSDEQLFAEGQRLMKEGEREFMQDGSLEKWLTAREKYLSPLIKRSPDGEYADKARAFIEKVDEEQQIRQIMGRFRRKSRADSEAERLFFNALEFEESRDRITALAKFRSLKLLLGGEEQSRVYVILAERHIEAIQSEPGTFEIINDALKRAEELKKSGNPVKADTIWSSIIEAYGSIDEYKVQVNYARNRRDGKDVEPLNFSNDKKTRSEFPDGEKSTHSNPGDVNE